MAARGVSSFFLLSGVVGEPESGGDKDDSFVCTLSGMSSLKSMVGKFEILKLTDVREAKDCSIPYPEVLGGGGGGMSSVSDLFLSSAPNES